MSIWSYMRAVNSGVAGPGAIMSVRNGPGAISFTRTPQLAHSLAITSVSAWSAAFDEQYNPSPAPGRNAPVVTTFTIAPPPCSRMRSAHRDESHIGPSVLVAYVFWNNSGLESASVVPGDIAALLTTMSTRPNAEYASSTRASI